MSDQKQKTLCASCGGTAEGKSLCPACEAEMGHQGCSWSEVGHYPPFGANELRHESQPMAPVLEMMHDIVSQADDTLWINSAETVFERCWWIVENQEGRARLEREFPNYA